MSCVGLGAEAEEEKHRRLQSYRDTWNPCPSRQSRGPVMWRVWATAPLTTEYRCPSCWAFATVRKKLCKSTRHNSQHTDQLSKRDRCYLRCVYLGDRCLTVIGEKKVKILATRSLFYFLQLSLSKLSLWRTLECRKLIKCWKLSQYCTEKYTMRAGLQIATLKAGVKHTPGGRLRVWTTLLKRLHVSTSSASRLRSTTQERPSYAISRPLCNLQNDCALEASICLLYKKRWGSKCLTKHPSKTSPGFFQI